MAASDPNSRGGAPAPQAAGLFETPLIVDEMPDSASINAALRAAILRRQQEDGGLAISNVGGWHSDTNMLSWGGEAAQALSARIAAAVDRFTVDIRGGEVRRHKWAPEMWANVSPPGASNRHHCHPGAYWSAVYYVDDGYEGSPDRELGGELVLFDPRMPTVRMAAPDLRFRRPGQQPEHDEQADLRQPGQAVGEAEHGATVRQPAVAQHHPGGVHGEEPGGVRDRTGRQLVGDHQQLVPPRVGGPAGR